MYIRGTHHVVRQRAPWRSVVVILVVVAAAAWGGWYLFDYGRLQAGYDSKEALRQINLLELRVKQYRADNREVNEKVAILEQSKNIDHEAYSRIENDLQGLRDELSELKQQVTFYEGIISPGGIVEGVHVKTLHLERNTEPNSYRFKLILIQGPKKAKRVKGAVTFAVRGVVNGDEKTFSFKKLTGSKSSSKKYSFKYFQNFQGEMVLPKGIKPTDVVVTVMPTGKRKSKVETVFNWADITG